MVNGCSFRLDIFNELLWSAGFYILVRFPLQESRAKSTKTAVFLGDFLQSQTRPNGDFLFAVFSDVQPKPAKVQS